MDVVSVYRYARISPYKARQVCREIQGLPVSQALDVVTFTPQKAAHLVGKTLKSAIANAENNFDLMADSLVVKECVAGEGPSFRRFKARARGSAAPIRRHTSHIRVVLTDDAELDEPKPVSLSQKKDAPPTPEAKGQSQESEISEVDLGLVFDSPPEQVDDLKQISGVGPQLEEKLNGLGIYTFSQIANWSSEQVSAFDDLLSFKGRIDRDEWIRQAKELSGG